MELPDADDNRNRFVIQRACFWTRLSERWDLYDGKYYVLLVGVFFLSHPKKCLYQSNLKSNVIRTHETN